MQSKTLVNGFGLIILLSAILVTALGAKGCEPLQGTSNNPPAGGYLSGSSVKLPVIWNVAAEAIASDKIFINCDSAYSGGTKFRIERKTNTSDYRLVATANGPEYEDTGLTPTTTYSYRIKAVGPDNVQSDYSNEASATTLNPSDRDRPHQHQIDSGSSNQQRAQNDQVSSAEPELDAVAEFLFNGVDDLPAPLPTGYAFLGGGDLLLTSEETWNRSQNFPPGKEHAAYIILPQSVRAEELSTADIRLMEFIDGSWVIVLPDKKGKLHATGPKAGYIGPDEAAPAKVTGPRPWVWVIAPPVTTTGTAITITNTNQTEITGIPAVTVSTYSNITITGITPITPVIISPISNTPTTDIPVTQPISPTVLPVIDTTTPPITPEITLPITNSTTTDIPVTQPISPTVFPVIDTVAPTIPDGLQIITVTTSSVTLSWQSVTDNIRVVGYKVYRDGVQIATVSGEDGGTGWTQKNPINKPPVRYHHAMAYDSLRKKVILFGGRFSAPSLQDTWEWDGVNWIQKDPTNRPPTRYGHAMAYDSVRQKVVLFGGLEFYPPATGILYDDTWEWDGVNWTQITSATKPPARYFHAMVYDSIRQKTILFGGNSANNGGNIQDTWEWDGTNWTQIITTNNPQPRCGHGMVYDSSRNKTVLFGGWNGPFLNDSWEWDGRDWKLIELSNKPQGRYLSAMTYDSVHRKTILFSGHDGTLNYTIEDEWEWDGTNWTQMNSVNKPASRFGHAMAYDLNRSKAILFGGMAKIGSSIILQQDTWEWPGNPVYNDTGLNPATTYTYAVVAYDTAGNASGCSGTIAATTLPFPDNTPRWAQVVAGVWHTMAIKTDGTLWAWGDNAYGKLGLNDSINRTSAAQVGADTNWKQVATALTHSMAIKTDGTLWGWGNNYNGQLGLGNTLNRAFPAQVGTETNWQMVACGENHSIALKADGTLWAWGWNYYGQLGLGDNISRISPAQVGSGNNWQQVSNRDGHTLAVKTDGTLWAWGWNEYGQLGLGDTLNRAFPVQVGTETNWQMVACGEYHSVALKTDGTLWTWGKNQWGSLGLSGTSNRLSPIQVGNNTNWQLIACGENHTIALKTDNTLWAWGYNNHGQLGLGDTIDRLSPTQVGIDTHWERVTCSLSHTMALKADDTLWVWGNNYFGQLGLGDTVNRLVPTQVGQ